MKLSKNKIKQLLKVKNQSQKRQKNIYKKRTGLKKTVGRKRALNLRNKTLKRYRQQKQMGGGWEDNPAYMEKRGELIVEITDILTDVIRATDDLDKSTNMNTFKKKLTNLSSEIGHYLIPANLTELNKMSPLTTMPEVNALQAKQRKKIEIGTLFQTLNKAITKIQNTRKNGNVIYTPTSKAEDTKRIVENLLTKLKVMFGKEQLFVDLKNVFAEAEAAAEMPAAAEMQAAEMQGYEVPAEAWKARGQEQQEAALEQELRDMPGAEEEGVASKNVASKNVAQNIIQGEEKEEDEDEDEDIIRQRIKDNIRTKTQTIISCTEGEKNKAKINELLVRSNDISIDMSTLKQIETDVEKLYKKNCDELIHIRNLLLTELSNLEGVKNLFNAEESAKFEILKREVREAINKTVWIGKQKEVARLTAIHQKLADLQNEVNLRTGLEIKTTTAPVVEENLPAKAVSFTPKKLEGENISLAESPLSGEEEYEAPPVRSTIKKTSAEGPALAEPALAKPALAGPALAGPAFAKPALAGPAFAKPKQALPDVELLSMNQIAAEVDVVNTSIATNMKALNEIREVKETRIPAPALAEPAVLAQGEPALAQGEPAVLAQGEPAVAVVVEGEPVVAQGASEQVPVEVTPANISQLVAEEFRNQEQVLQVINKEEQQVNAVDNLIQANPEQVPPMQHQEVVRGLKEKFARLTQEIESNKEEKQSLFATNLAIFTKQQQKIAEQQKELEELNKFAGEASEAQSERIDFLQKALTEAREEFKTAFNDLKGKYEELHEDNQTMERQRGQLVNEVNILEQEVVPKLEQYYQSRIAEDIEQQEILLDQLNTKMEYLNSENDQLRQEVEELNARLENQPPAVGPDVDALKAKLNRSRERRAAVESDLSRGTELQAELARTIEETEAVNWEGEEEWSPAAEEAAEEVAHKPSFFGSLKQKFTKDARPGKHLERLNKNLAELKVELSTRKFNLEKVIEVFNKNEFVSKSLRLAKVSEYLNYVNKQVSKIEKGTANNINEMNGYRDEFVTLGERLKELLVILYNEYNEFYEHVITEEIIDTNLTKEEQRLMKSVKLIIRNIENGTYDIIGQQKKDASKNWFNDLKSFTELIKKLEDKVLKPSELCESALCPSEQDDLIQAIDTRVDAINAEVEPLTNVPVFENPVYGAIPSEAGPSEADPSEGESDAPSMTPEEEFGLVANDPTESTTLGSTALGSTTLAPTTLAPTQDVPIQISSEDVSATGTGIKEILVRIQYPIGPNTPGPVTPGSVTPGSVTSVIAPGGESLEANVAGFITERSKALPVSTSGAPVTEPASLELAPVELAPVELASVAPAPVSNPASPESITLEKTLDKIDEIATSGRDIASINDWIKARMTQLNVSETIKKGINANEYLIQPTEFASLAQILPGFKLVNVPGEGVNSLITSLLLSSSERFRQIPQENKTMFAEIFRTDILTELFADDEDMKTTLENDAQPIANDMDIEKIVKKYSDKYNINVFIVDGREQTGETQIVQKRIINPENKVWPVITIFRSDASTFDSACNATNQYVLPYADIGPYLLPASNPFATGGRGKKKKYTRRIGAKNYMKPKKEEYFTAEDFIAF